MHKDPIIEEIHKTRKKIEKSHEDFGESYFDYLLKAQEKYKNRLVSRSESQKDKERNIKKAI
jgi:hypothetical protein